MANGEGAAKPVRRRRKNVAGGRRHAHLVRVTPEEEALLLQRATSLGVTVPRLLVESALAAQGETATERQWVMAELFRVHRLLGTIANNVNQMAKATNATHEVQADMSATFEVVRRTAGRVSDAIDRLSS